MARISEHLTRREQRSGWFGLIGGLGLGALAGGALAFFLRSRDQEPPFIPTMPLSAAPRRADDAVVLRGTPPPGSAPAEQDDDAPILLKTPTSAVPVAAATEDTSGRIEPAPAATPPPTIENEAIPAAAVSPEESEAAPAPVEPTVENEALPAAAIAETPTTPGSTASTPVETPTSEDRRADGSRLVAGDYPGSVAPIGDHCPPGYEIKGNRSRNGDLLYHTPESNNFTRTKPEACFATEADAEAAGFRKARS